MNTMDDFLARRRHQSFDTHATYARICSRIYSKLLRDYRRVCVYIYISVETI